MKKTLLLYIVLIMGENLCFSQSNTAVASGSIGKCAVWDYPYTMANTVSGDQTISSGITVTVDQNRNIGVVNLSGTGALDLSGTNGITMSGAGSQINCRWDATVQNFSMNVLNNNGDPVTDYPVNVGTFFTAPYSGNYIWNRGSGWNAYFNSSTVYNAAVAITKNNETMSGTSNSYTVFFQSQSGSCPVLGSGPASGPIWKDSRNLNSIAAGDNFQFKIGTQYITTPSCGVNFSALIGNSQILYNN